MNNYSIILYRLQPQEIAFITNTVFGDNDRLLVFLPVTVNTRTHSFGMVFPDIIMAPAQCLHLLRSFQVGDGQRIMGYTTVIAHAKKIDLGEMVRHKFHKPPVT